MKVLNAFLTASLAIFFVLPAGARDLELTFPEKVTPSGGFASNFHRGENIEKSFDGNMMTLYHSHWRETVFPVTLRYDFTNAERIDYLVYYPRQDATNGLFKQVEIWYVAGKERKKLGDYDFGGKNAPTRIDFDKPLRKPASIEFVVKSGVGDNKTGFASCAEMEFYRNRPEKNYDLTAIFADRLCTTLRGGITQKDIDKIPNATVRTLAQNLLEKKEPDTFRIAEYKPYQHPDIMAKINKTGSYSLRDNPTGIAVTKGEELLLFVEDLHGQSVSILVQNLDKGFGGNSYPLKNGVNIFTMEDEGLVYVTYLTETAAEAPVKLFIASGTINGYFDSTKGHTAADWKALLENYATYKYLDVLGKYAHLTFTTQDFRQYTPDGLALINTYDRIVKLEHEFMGLYKYNRLFRNRVYLHTDFSDMWMYATNYHTAYNIRTMPGLCDVNKLLTGEVWGPAHEIGHVNQTRPGLRWQGMTEVTNNIFSLYVQTSFENPSRIMSERIKGYGNRYNKAQKTIVEKGIAFCLSDDVFCQLTPFWQLKLYVHDVLGNTDFYKDIFEKIRVSPDPATGGECQLNFVKLACETAKLDLTDFFRAWGFLTPVDKVVNDYGAGQFTVTQEQIDALLQEIEKMRLPKPKHDNIHLINDVNICEFVN
jgi:hypothetical protein